MNNRIKLISGWVALSFGNAEVLPVTDIMVNGTLDSRINIVFLGDGYILNNMDNFINDVNEVTDALFDEVPYSNYINFFNVYAIEVPSNESGTDHPGNAPDCGNHANDVFFADTYFNSSFDQYNIHRLLVIQNIGAAYDVLADNFPQWDVVFIIVNHTMYGGSGGSFATFSRDSYSTEIAIHELGHTFPGLSDEYWAGFQYAQENVNMTQETNPDIVIWNPWLYDYGIGIYNYENPGNEWFRPHQNCKMKSLGEPFCSVCSEHTILSIYNLIDVTEGVQPDNFDLSINLSDIYRTINNVGGVSDTIDVSVVRRTGGSYSGTDYNVRDNTSFDGRYVTLPEDAIYEIRFIERDIRGTVLG